MLSVINTSLFAVSTIALIVLMYHTVRTGRHEDEDTTGDARKPT